MIEDADMGIYSSVTIDNIKITEDESLLPNYDIVLRDTKQVGTIQKVQQQIDALSGNGASAGYNNSQIGDIAYSALKDKFLSKEYDNKTLGSLNVSKDITVDGQAILNDVVAKGIADFQKGIKVGGDTQFGANYVEGVTGMGGKIDKDANAELESLTLRRFLQVPEIDYNRVEIKVGDKWRAPGGGVIKSVDTDNKIVTLKLEDGEIGIVS